jgi:acetolactate synthase regulatory subunit
MNYNLEVEIEDVEGTIKQIYRLSRLCGFKITKIATTPSVTDRTYRVSLQIERTVDATTQASHQVEKLESFTPKRQSRLIDRMYHGIRTVEANCAIRSTLAYED